MNNYCIRHRLEIDHECSGVSHNHNRPQSSAGHLSSSNNKAINEKRLNFFQNHFQKQPESKQLPSQNNSRNGNNFQASNMVSNINHLIILIKNPTSTSQPHLQKWAYFNMQI